MKVLLIQPLHSGREPSVFPLSLGYIARPLLDMGCEVTVLDIHAHEYSQEETASKIEELSYDIVGINAFSTQYSYVKWLTSELKKYHQGRIILGGPLPTFNPSLVLEKTNADICVIGEGDITIKSIVENINHLEKVKGIYFSKNGKVIANPPQEYIEDINSIPFPPYDIFPTDIYFKHVSLFGASTKKTISLITARGCPYRCNFCSRVFGGVRARSVDNVIEEIKFLKQRFRIDSVYFVDELILISKKRMHELCDKIKSLNIIWGCQGRANLVDLDLLRHMRNSGCVHVGFGIESVSQKILDNMNKGVTAEQNEQAIKDAIKVGLLPVVQMIFGYPGEDKDTIRETVEFFRRVHYSPPTPDAKPYFSPITPLPGSPLYEDVLRDGLIKDEDEYLLKIEMGYFPGCPVVINLTEFSDEELLNLKTKMEQEIYANYRSYLKRHPWKYIHLLKKYWRYLKAYKSRYGYKATMRVIISRLFRINKGN